MEELIYFLKGIPTESFAGSTVPLVVFGIHALAMAYIYRILVDSNSNTKRHPLCSLLLTLFAILSGGTLASLLMGKVPGWLSSDRAVFGYGLAWFLMRFDFFFKVFTPLLYPSLFFVHSIFRAHVTTTILAISSKVFPQSIFSPVFLVIFTMHGGTWLTQLVLHSTEHSSFGSSSDDDFRNPSQALRVTFWSSLAYTLLMHFHVVPCYILNPALICLLALDCVVHDWLGKSTINFFVILEFPISLVLSLPQQLKKPKTI